ncbi:hypothetical protein QYF61_008082 [Mycteria americana]|uniref:Uncharacterized protein n=1 Tax=Mycteria americana TaxID=33587 RepID=A0AAN7RV98_MYCAM|nr:hypothetical protein QYF61_008082 [Mycteria americana]
MEGLLRRHGCDPSPLGVEWVKEKWCEPESVVERTEKCRGSKRDGRGKGTMCAILGACLMQAQDQYMYFRQVEKDNSESQLEIECLKADLQWERERTRLLEWKIYVMLTQAKEPPSIAQIRKLIVGTDPEDWDGDIWGDSD